MSIRADAVTVEPVRKILTIQRPPDVVFQRFTRGIGQWWPRETHSIGGDQVAEIVFEERIGGRVFERFHDGTEHEWGRVITWDPPHRFVMSWHPGNDPSKATELEVSFHPVSGGFHPENGTTRIELTHYLWERLGERAEVARGNYDSGWEGVLGRFLVAAG